MSRKPIWWKFHYVVYVVKEKAIGMAGAEEIMTAEDPERDVDVDPWVPKSQMRAAKVTHRMVNGVYEEIEHVEKTPDQLVIGDHIASIKLPVWLGQEKELEPEDPDELKKILDKAKEKKKPSDASVLPWNKESTDDKSEPEPEGTPEVEDTPEEAGIFQEERSDEAVKDVLKNALENKEVEEPVDVDQGTDTVDKTQGGDQEDSEPGPGIEDEGSKGTDEGGELDPTELW